MGMITKRYLRAILFAPPLAIALYFRQELARQEITGLTFFDLFFNQEKLEERARERAEKALSPLLLEDYDRSSSPSSSSSSSFSVSSTMKIKELFGGGEEEKGEGDEGEEGGAAPKPFA